MGEAIADFFLNKLGREWTVFLCSMIPIIELRGAIPLGYGFGLPLWQTYLLAVAGNMLPVPLILLLINKLLDWWMNCRVGFLRKFAGWLTRKAEKNREKIQKYGFLGVALFVAIPLPATGAWTGSLVAATIRMKFWRAMLSALIGVLTAGVIMSLICYGGIDFIIQLFSK